MWISFSNRMLLFFHVIISSIFFSERCTSMHLLWKFERLYLFIRFVVWDIDASLEIWFYWHKWNRFRYSFRILFEKSFIAQCFWCFFRFRVSLRLRWNWWANFRCFRFDRVSMTRLRNRLRWFSMIWSFRKLAVCMMQARRRLCACWLTAGQTSFLTRMKQLNRNRCLNIRFAFCCNC